MLDLPDVTLIATTSIDIEDTIKAMQICMSKANFGRVVFASHEKPVNLPEGVTYEYTGKISNIMDFNLLMWLDLWKYFTTSHCLTIQNHAYILDESQWQDEWLKADWQGAIWPIKENSYIADNGERVRNGNGGFSLRSRRLCELPTLLHLPLKEEQGYWNEDGNFVCYYRSTFLSQGIIYGTPEQAAKFSYETPVEENGWGTLPTFGFHRNKPC